VIDGIGARLGRIVTFLGEGQRASSVRQLPPSGGIHAHHAPGAGGRGARRDRSTPVARNIGTEMVRPSNPTGSRNNSATRSRLENRKRSRRSRLAVSNDSAFATGADFSLNGGLHRADEALCESL